MGKMSGMAEAPHNEPEQRIAQALDRIEQAAAALDTRHGQLRQATREALADIDRLIAKASTHG